MRKTVYLKCIYTNGAFSDERVFKLDLGGDKKYKSTASMSYFIEEEGPRNGDYRPGKIQARLLDEEGGHSLVSIPDGEVIYVPSSIIERQSISNG